MNEYLELDTIKDRFSFVINSILLHLKDLTIDLIGIITFIISFLQAIIILLLEIILYVPFVIIWIFYNKDFRNYIFANTINAERTLFDLWLKHLSDI